MADISKSGAKTWVAKASRGAIVTTGDTTANTWYEIASIATSASALPTGMVVGSVFKSPDTSSTQITLGTGDSVYPLTVEKIAKTDAAFTAEEGTIDVTDDSVSGFVAEILDGYKKISGTCNGFTKFNDSTGALETVTADFWGMFFDEVTDDGEGGYTVTPAENEALMFFMCLNKDAIATEVQNWLILPVVFPSLGGGAGLKDAQKRDLSWSKAEGPASLYKRTVFAADVI